MYAEAAKLAVAEAQKYTVGDPFAEDQQARAASCPRSSASGCAATSGRASRKVRSCSAGGPEAPAGLPKGYYVKPTVFGRVHPESTIAQEEIFGPVLSIITYKDEEEAVRIANDSIYGLGGGVWSKDEARADRVARRIRTGQVDINGGPFNMFAPFGGYKQSGHGREYGLVGVPRVQSPAAEAGAKDLNRDIPPPFMEDRSVRRRHQWRLSPVGFFPPRDSPSASLASSSSSIRCLGRSTSSY